MSEERFEIAFNGQIAEGADLESVKQKIGQIFKADENRLAQMFSGRRVIIKREADMATVDKYRGAFEKAGAICEVKSLNSGSDVSALSTPTEHTAHGDVSANSGASYVSRYPESDAIPQALLTDPLGIQGDSIQDLGVDIAPVGSPMQHEIKEIPEPKIDTSGMDMAPVGSDLSNDQKDVPPPPPDTSGLTLAD